MARSAPLIGLTITLVLFLCDCSQAASAPQQTPTPISTLTAAERAQLAQLEARPLKLPSMPADGSCPVSSSASVKPYLNSNETHSFMGLGPVYAEGIPWTESSQNIYFAPIFYTDPTVKGVVLIRGKQLDGRLDFVFVGAYAAGPVSGTDTIDGKRMDQHPEAALPADRPLSNSNASVGWAIWPVQLGVGKTYNGCAGFQVDTGPGTEVLVVH